METKGKCSRGYKMEKKLLVGVEITVIDPFSLVVKTDCYFCLTNEETLSKSFSE